MCGPGLPFRGAFTDENAARRGSLGLREAVWFPEVRLAQPDLNGEGVARFALDVCRVGAGGGDRGDPLRHGQRQAPGVLTITSRRLGQHQIDAPPRKRSLRRTCGMSRPALSSAGSRRPARGVEHAVYGPPPGKLLCGAVGISAAGLRRLAEEMDAGWIESAPQWFARRTWERRAASRKAA